MTDTRDLVRRQFGAHAQNYVASSDHSKGESLERMLEVVRPQRHWRALDIATGGGHTALAFAPFVREVVATDLTAAMLAAAERFLRGKGIVNASFREADATALPFGAAEFDLVTCRVAPHHFPDCARFVREMARVLRPGGVAAMVDNVVPEDEEAARFINDFEKRRDPSHNWAHTQSDWRRFFAAAGLEIRHAEVFRKQRDFDYWTGMMSVDGETKAALRRMLADVPPAARDALSPESSGAGLKFYLTEILLVADRSGAG